MLCLPKHDSKNDECRRPKDTPARQQRLKAWSPTPTSRTALHVLFIFSIIFVPLGVILLTTAHVVEFEYDYTDCKSVEHSSTTCAEIRLDQYRMNETCTCVHNFTLDHFLPGEVTFYYALDNFFQNHRRYVKSRDDVQMHGEEVTSPDDVCKPYDRDAAGRTIAPCGAVANSLFNDTFGFANTSSSVPIVRTGITRERDKGDKFNNRQFMTVKEAFENFAKPLFWQIPASELDPSDDSNNGYLNEAFIVWMRVAAFANFRKKYGLLGDGWDGLSEGSYTLTIDYNYPVTAFDGRKKFIVSADSWMGSKNDFLGIAYLVLGVLCFLAGISLFVARYMQAKQQIARISMEKLSVASID